MKTRLARVRVRSRPYRSDRMPVDIAPIQHPMSYIDTTAPVTPILVSRCCLFTHCWILNKMSGREGGHCLHALFGCIRSIHRSSATITPITPWSYPNSKAPSETKAASLYTYQGSRGRGTDGSVSGGGRMGVVCFRDHLGTWLVSNLEDPALRVRETLFLCWLRGVYAWEVVGMVEVML